MQNPAAVLKNDTHKLLLDIQKDYQIFAKRPDLIIINYNNQKIGLAKLWMVLSQLTTE